MPRIPFPDIAKAGDEVRETLGRLPAEVGIFKMLAHAETLLKPTMRLGGAMLGKMKLDPLLRELALLHASLKAASMNGCSMCPWRKNSVPQTRRLQRSKKVTPARLAFPIKNERFSSSRAKSSSR